MAAPYYVGAYWGLRAESLHCEVVSDLGFSLSLWNRNPVDASFSTLCGATPPTPFIKNHFALPLPLPSDEAAELYDKVVAHRILMALVTVWQLDWATFASYAMRSRQSAERPGIVVGWRTFMSPTKAGPLPPGLRTESVAGGVLITTGRDPLHVSEAEFSAAVQYAGEPRA